MFYENFDSDMHPIDNSYRLSPIYNPADSIEVTPEAVDVLQKAGLFKPVMIFLLSFLIMCLIVAMMMFA